MITQAVESAALATVLKFTYSLMIRITREIISTGIVVSSNVLQEGKNFLNNTILSNEKEIKWLVTKTIR